MSMDPGYYQGIYARTLSRTGNAEQAQEAVSVAQAALKQVYHSVMVRTGGDAAAAAAAERQAAEQVGQLAQLIPIIRAEGDVDGSAAALREMMGVLESMGYDGGRQGLHGWLRANVRDDAVLRAAGFDARAVRTLPRPEGWPDDFEALMSLLREQLELVQERSGGRLTDAELQAQLDMFRASAHRFGYDPAPPTTERTVEGNPEGPAGSISVSELGVPQRV